MLMPINPSHVKLHNRTRTKVSTFHGLKLVVLDLLPRLLSLQKYHRYSHVLCELITIREVKVLTVLQVCVDDN